MAKTQKIKARQASDMMQAAGRKFLALGRNIEAMGIPDRENMAGAIEIHIEKLQRLTDSLRGGRNDTTQNKVGD